MMPYDYVTVPRGEIAIARFGRRDSAYVAANEGKLEGIILRENLIAQFPVRKPFAFHVPVGVGGSYRGPLVIMFRFQAPGLIPKISNVCQDIWEKNKQQFLIEYATAVDSLQKECQFFSELEMSGVLVKKANELAVPYALPILVFGAGRVVETELDPFDYKNVDLPST